MRIATIDFETYYDKDYSLSKMTTEAYLRDPRFQIIGVGVKLDDGPTDWYSGSDPGKFLRSLDYSKYAVLCHHTMFDGAIMSWHLGIRPKLWLDTLSMARPTHGLSVGGSLAALAAHYGIGKKGTAVLDAIGKRREDFTPEQLERYGAYCTNDVDLTYELFQYLKVGFSITELIVIDKTIRMFTEPTITLDKDVLRSHLESVLQQKSKLLRSIHPNEEEARRIIMSNLQFAEALHDLGVSPPTKVSPRTGKTTYAFAKTDQGLLALREHPNPDVQALVAARLGAKSTIEETRTQSFLEIADRGPLPIMLNYYGARTGRFSGGDKVNLQNLPKRNNNIIRNALRAPEGHVLVACDLAQIEARIVAWLAGQEDLVQAFREGRDVYSEFATEVYGRTITKADKIERFVGKTCILGLGYGMGAEKFKDTLALGMGGVTVDIDINEAQRIVRLYRNKNYNIAALWQRCNGVLHNIMSGVDGSINEAVSYSGRGIKLPSGFHIQYPYLQVGAANSSELFYLNSARTVKKFKEDKPLSDTEYTKIYGGKVVENIVQALAALVIREQMAVLGQRYTIAFQVHDEIVFVVPKEDIEEASKHIIAVMQTPPTWAPDLPVACELSFADNYGSV